MKSANLLADLLADFGSRSRAAIELIKLPDKYKLLPAPKAETTQPQDPTVVQLSRTSRAPQIVLRENEASRVPRPKCRMYDVGSLARHEPRRLSCERMRRAASLALSVGCTM